MKTFADIDTINLTLVEALENLQAIGCGSVSDNDGNSFLIDDQLEEAIEADSSDNNYSIQIDNLDGYAQHYSLYQFDDDKGFHIVFSSYVLR